jgi:drug/metabolite transporter (DMT)-like permease
MWYAYAILVAFLWGMYTLLESKTVSKYHASFMFVIAGLCSGACAVILLVFKWKTLIPLYKKAAGDKTLITAIGASIFGVVLANYLLLLALENAPTPNIVMAMAYSAPVFTILGGILIFRNGVNMMELLGMGLTIGGIAIICFNID